MDRAREILSEIIFFQKYSQEVPGADRREVFSEIVDRNKAMHVAKFPHLEEEIEKAYSLVYQKKVLPSMRSLQFAGLAAELSNVRVYNCAFLPIDDYRGFSETMFLLLSGCFKEGTLVKTKDGDKKIEDVTVLDEILTYDTEKKEYYWVHPFWAGETPTASKEKMELEFEDGSVISCTEDHMFYTKNRGWVEAKDLTEEDDIETYPNVDATATISNS